MGWFPPTIIVAPTTEPVTLAQAKDQCGVLTAETIFDNQITALIKSARAHVEKYCAVRFAEQTIEVECESFCDMARLPEAPLKTLTSITYVDLDGAPQTVPDTVYDVHKDGLEPSISLKYGQAWPSIRNGSRIKLTGIFGGSTPENVQHAMRMLIGHWFLTREAVNIGNIVSKVDIAVDDLLCNDRRGV
jgi:uncharacterized phiE125 gp8 family phage protein